jgi:ABC-2 type transport system ATP-binding protein
LYELVRGGLTVFVTTAYLDEAERCDRVGLMHQGRLIRCDTPAALKTHLPETCYEVRSPDLRRTREALSGAGGVTSVEPAGAALHLFLDTARSGIEHLRELAPGAEFHQIAPSLEDVFIALIRKQEQHAA